MIILILENSKTFVYDKHLKIFMNIIHFSFYSIFCFLFILLFFHHRLSPRIPSYTSTPPPLIPTITTLSSMYMSSFFCSFCFLIGTLCFIDLFIIALAYENCYFHFVFSTLLSFNKLTCCYLGLWEILFSKMKIALLPPDCIFFFLYLI